MGFLKTSWRYVELAALLALILCAYTFGHRTATNADQAAQVVAIKAQAEADTKNLQSQLKTAADNAAASQAIAVANAAAHAQQHLVYRTLTQQVTQYVATHPDDVACTLDDDGLRLWREANSGQLSTAPAEH